MPAAIAAIVNELAADPSAGMVFLATDAVKSKALIVAMRRQGLQTPLFGNQTLIGETAVSLFAQDPEAKQKPGALLNGIYSCRHT